MEMGDTNVTERSPFLYNHTRDISTSSGVSNLSYGMPPPPAQEPPDAYIMDTLFLLHTYYQPSLTSLGIVMNIATFALLMGSKLASFSSTRYLAASTFNDLVFLIILLITWFTDRGFPLYRLGALCHVTTFFLRSTKFLTTWYTVCYSVDRFLSTWLPGWEKQLCTTTKANIVIISIAIVALVVYLNISLTVYVNVHSGRYMCIPHHSFFPALAVLRRMDIFINMFTPYIIIVLTWLACAVRCYMDRRMRARRPVVSRNRVSLDPTLLSEGQNSTYIIFIAIFLLCTSPLRIEQCKQTLREMAHPDLPVPLWSRYLESLLNYPFYTRSCLNFVICLVAHRGFRSVLVHNLRNVFKRLRKLLQKSRAVKSQNDGISLDDIREEEESRVALCGNSPNKRECIEL